MGILGTSPSEVANSLAMLSTERKKALHFSNVYFLALNTVEKVTTGLAPFFKHWTNAEILTLHLKDQWVNEAGFPKVQMIPQFLNSFSKFPEDAVLIIHLTSRVKYDQRKIENDPVLLSYVEEETQIPFSKFCRDVIEANTPDNVQFYLETHVAEDTFWKCNEAEPNYGNVVRIPDSANDTNNTTKTTLMLHFMYSPELHPIVGQFSLFTGYFLNSMLGEYPHQSNIVIGDKFQDNDPFYLCLPEIEKLLQCSVCQQDQLVRTQSVLLSPDTQKISFNVEVNIAKFKHPENMKLVKTFVKQLNKFERLRGLKESNLKEIVNTLLKHRKQLKEGRENDLQRKRKAQEVEGDEGTPKKYKATEECLMFSLLKKLPLDPDQDVFKRDICCNTRQVPMGDVMNVVGNLLKTFDQVTGEFKWLLNRDESPYCLYIYPETHNDRFSPRQAKIQVGDYVVQTSFRKQSLGEFFMRMITKTGLEFEHHPALPHIDLTNFSVEIAYVPESDTTIPSEHIFSLNAWDSTFQLFQFPPKLATYKIHSPALNPNSASASDNTISEFSQQFTKSTNDLLWKAQKNEEEVQVPILPCIGFACCKSCDKSIYLRYVQITGENGVWEPHCCECLVQKLGFSIKSVSSLIRSFILTQSTQGTHFAPDATLNLTHNTLSTLGKGTDPYKNHIQLNVYCLVENWHISPTDHFVASVQKYNTNADLTNILDSLYSPKKLQYKWVSLSEDKEFLWNGDTIIVFPNKNNSVSKGEETVYLKFNNSEEVKTVTVENMNMGKFLAELLQKFPQEFNNYMDLSNLHLQAEYQSSTGNTIVPVVCHDATKTIRDLFTNNHPNMEENLVTYRIFTLNAPNAPNHDTHDTQDTQDTLISPTSTSTTFLWKTHKGNQNVVQTIGYCICHECERELGFITYDQISVLPYVHARILTLGTCENEQLVCYRCLIHKKGFTVEEVEALRSRILQNTI